ncbi:DUF4256 domain-containing protein [Rhizobium leguminosarum]|uniref:hypothetical protein n=1 Tax=Rhizobium leguminosarum TaxID=384 RepID=UPI001C961DD3|nr:hypothetical protein [Rhizobium leguminosarum]MBY5819889.1 DUF4256 domain-containing protein [Rhizobium leguminosarum]
MTADEIESEDDSFYPGDLQPMEDAPREELLTEIGWRRDIYHFEFYKAVIFAAQDTPTSSWIEVAHSRQLGGAYVVWFSGVSTLEAPDFCTYGWIDFSDLKQDFSDAFFRKSLLQGAPITGYYRNVEAYYETRASNY